MSQNEKLAKLKALYARIPKLRCQRKCQACCSNIGMSFFEHGLLTDSVGIVPVPMSLSKLATEGGAIIGETLSMGKEVRICPFLKNGTCSVYELRPFICRMWGATWMTRCPHGCKPERWLSDE